MDKSTERFMKNCAELGVVVEPREFPGGTHTAQEAADAIGVKLGQIVKSLVFTADSKPVVCLVSGDNRLDLDLLKQASGAESIDKADAVLVKEATSYSIGGVPPFGYQNDVSMFIDKDLLQYEEVWAAAGSASMNFAISPQRLVEIVGGSVCELAAR